MTARIALATTVALTEPDVDDVALLSHLPEAELAAWDDPSVDWAAYDLVALRSTWNYTDHLDDFLAWAARVSEVTTLINPLDIIRWNTDKRYLADLDQRDLPVVPTTFIAPGRPVDTDLGGTIVVKPSVGAGSAGARMFRNAPDDARAHLDTLHRAGKVAMIQPYLEQVDISGETAMVYLDGRFSHAARKAAILSGAMSNATGLYADEEISACEATAAERELADRVVATLPPLAYTRVDLLPTDDGPVVLELELVEPSLFLYTHPEAPARAAAAVRTLLS